MSPGWYRGRSRLILLLLLAAAVLWVFQLRRGREEPSGAVAAGLIPSFDQLSSVSFVSGADSVAVQAGTEESWIVHPIHDRVDPFFMAELGRLLGSIRPNRMLGDSVSIQAGLSPPRSLVHLELSDGRDFTVELGDTVPIGSQIYARVRPGPADVLLLDLFPVRRYLTPDLEALRDKRAVVLGGGPVDSVAVLVPGRDLRAVRIRSDQWESRIPPGLPLDPPSINRVIQDFRSPSIQGFPPAGEELEALGLEPPQALWVLFQRSRAESVRVGTATPDGRSVRILPAGRTLPALLDSELWNDLTGGWPSLADLSLLATGADDWVSLRYLEPAGVPGYTREDGRWLRGPERRREERPAAFRRDLDNLGHLRWRSFPWPESPPPPGQDRITLELRTASRAETLYLASPRDSLGWARSSTRPFWGRVSPLTWRIWSYRADNSGL